MASISTYLKNPNGNTSSIIYQIRDGRDKKIIVPAELSINPKLWNAEEKKIKNTQKALREVGEVEEKNKYLTDRAALIMKIYLRLKNEIGKDNVTVRDIKKELNKGDVTPTLITSDVLVSLDLFPETHKAKSSGYIRKAKKVKLHLTYFCKISGIRNLTFAHFDHARLQQYHNYLVSNTDEFVYEDKLIKKVPQASGSVKEHLKIIRAIAKFSQGHVEVNPEIFKYKVTESNKEARILEWPEIKAILEYIPKSATEELTKDIFLFSCFSGLRISAIQDLKKSDIAGGFINWINTKKKTTTTESTTVHRFSAPIIRKYKDLATGSNLFPPIAQQTLNTTIKVICGAAKIEGSQEVHNHTGRHSYNSLLYALGIDTFIRNEELGHTHSSINEKVYTKVDEQERKSIIVKTMDRLEEILKERKQQYVTTYDDL